MDNVRLSLKGLGGGGSAGNAWLIGVIAGLFEAGLEVTGADLTIGTSDGSTAAAQITSAVIAAAADPADMRRKLGACAPGGRGVAQASANAVACHRRRSAFQPALAAAANAHHGGRRPYR